MSQFVLDGFVLLKYAHPHTEQSDNEGNEKNENTNLQQVTAVTVPQSPSSPLSQKERDENEREERDEEKEMGNARVVYSRVRVEDLLLFGALTFLDVSHNNLRFMDFSVLPRLNELRMTHNHISSIDSPPSGFRYLKKLDLSNNNLNEQSIYKLGILFQTKLEHLNISANHLSILPKEICLLQKMGTLIMNENQLGNTQFSLLGFLPRLETLSMNNNRITKYIHHSGIYLQLKSLSLNFNNVPSIEELMELTKLPQLNKIEVCNNPFTLEGGNLLVPSFYSPQKNIEFIASSTPLEYNDKEHVHPTQKKKRRNTDRKFDVFEWDASNDLATARDWIPDFILDELYGETSTAKTRDSQQMIKALRTTIQRPPLTVHFMPMQKASTKMKQKRLATFTQQQLQQLTEHEAEREGSESGESSRSGMSSSGSSRSISNLDEAEVQLTKMKQRLLLAQKNFEEMLSQTK